MAEIKTVTGWGINTCRFLVFLAKDKQAAWSSSIQTIINRGSSTYNEIETLVGRLNHCGYIIPITRHFLHTIRGIMRGSANKQIQISSKEIRYLHIWKQFLSYAKSGISIKNIVYRRPTHIRWDDRCPIGIVGVALTGKAYCYNLPRQLQGRVSNNALEFLASMVGCWVDILDRSVIPQSCILALTDNSSTCG